MLKYSEASLWPNPRWGYQLLTSLDAMIRKYFIGTRTLTQTCFRIEFKDLCLLCAVKKCQFGTRFPWITVTLPSNVYNTTGYEIFFGVNSRSVELLIKPKSPLPRSTMQNTSLSMAHFSHDCLYHTASFLFLSAPIFLLSSFSTWVFSTNSSARITFHFQ